MGVVAACSNCLYPAGGTEDQPPEKRRRIEPGKPCPNCEKFPIQVKRVSARKIRAAGHAITVYPKRRGKKRSRPKPSKYEPVHANWEPWHNDD